MATATAYLDRVLPAIDRLADRFTALVTAAPDPAAPIPAPTGPSARRPPTSSP
jgi:hypothetical protein